MVALTDQNYAKTTARQYFLGCLLLATVASLGFIRAAEWSRVRVGFGVIRDRSLRAGNRFKSAVLRKRRKVRALACVAKGHGGGRREPLQPPAMLVARWYRSIAWATLALARGFPAITLDVHLQDRGVVQ